MNDQHYNVKHIEKRKISLLKWNGWSIDKCRKNHHVSCYPDNEFSNQNARNNSKEL